MKGRLERMEIIFNCNGEKYSVLFLPCGFMATVTKLSTGKTRDIAYNKNMQSVDFIRRLSRINFDY